MFTLTGSLNTARDLRTAVLLADGKVLTAGGIGSTSVLSSAELYDPVAGTFSATGNLHAARQNAAATLLDNGTVLIAGGAGTAVLTIAELYSSRFERPMPIFIALLRGVNVGGNILKMDRLRELCAKLGMNNPRTYLQSGNIVFEAQGSASHWAETIERKLAGESRLLISVIVRTAAEMSGVLAGNPFLKEKATDTARLATAFLQHAPAKPALAALAALKIGSERFHCAGKEIYLHCPDGFANAKLYALDKVLSQKTTTRNWNTVTKLCEISAE
jgi:uncharacterized protein (DUF1697 family)